MRDVSGSPRVGRGDVPDHRCPFQLARQPGAVHRELWDQWRWRLCRWPLTLTLLDAWERCRLRDDISYEEWVRYVFDHPVLDPQWWWQDLQQWNESADPARTLSFLTLLFEKPEGLLGRFTRAQIDQGLNFLVSNDCSNHMFVLSDANLPWANRRGCLEAMIPLYAKLMARVYQDHLGHNQHGPGDPERPNDACYMWWDVIPLYGAWNIAIATESTKSCSTSSNKCLNSGRNRAWKVCCMGSAIGTCTFLTAPNRSCGDSCVGWISAQNSETTRNSLRSEAFSSSLGSADSDTQVTGERRQP